MRIIIMLLLFMPLNLLAQQEGVWMNHLEKPAYPEWELKIQNEKKDYLRYDFSSALNPNTAFLAFIGPQYKRLKIVFKSVEKANNKGEYKISGTSVVGTNKCDFEGVINIEQIREFKKLHYGIDEMYQDSGIVKQGVLIGRYTFKENPEQNHSGVFKGVMTLWWYLDKDGKVKYDKIEAISDHYKNNQYVGTWTEYGKATSKTCNWGEYRIPFSGDLDIGAGEFSVNAKYYSNGWTGFKIE